MGSERMRVSSGSPWEEIVGYSRAVRAGKHIFVAGTTGTDRNGAAVGDTTSQTRVALEKIVTALEQAGATVADVVRTRVYVVDISEWDAIAKVHSEFFGEVRPAATMVEVRKLIGVDITVEIEVDAVVS